MPCSFFRRDADVVARALLGMGLYVRKNGLIRLARLVEVEAYLGASDPASHAYRGETIRNRSMFKDGGVCYAYRCYGVHVCMNVVTSRAGNGQGVLLRAAEPLLGIEAMAEARGLASGKTLNRKHLLSGPGKLTQAMGVEMSDDGRSLREKDFKIVALGSSSPKIMASPRVGITKATDLLLRFTVKDSPFLSRP